MRRIHRIAVIGGIVALCIAFLHVPKYHLQPKLVEIPEGATLSDTADILKAERLITSSFLFKVSAVLLFGADDIKAGEYLVSKHYGPILLALRLIRGEYGIERVRVFIPEGVTVERMGDILSRSLVGFDAEEFVRKATPLEGYLFPDTYLFPENAKPAQVIVWLYEHFKERVAPLSSEIKASGHSLEEIIIMASIIEREVRIQEDRRIVSGILWKRISIDMPLQVDAPFVYIIGKGSADLTRDDLAMDSPYNTYANKGLPPGPIANPGLDAIEAALRPVETEYLFYLSDAQGTTHYARNFEEHKANKALYLD